MCDLLSFCAIPPPYVCARGVLNEGGKRFGMAIPGVSRWGGRASRPELRRGSRFISAASLFCPHFPRRLWITREAWGGGEVYFLRLRSARAAVARSCAYDKSSRSTRFPSSSNMRPRSVGRSEAWARAWQSRQSNSRLFSPSAISGVLMFSGVKCSLWWTISPGRPHFTHRP